MTMYVVIHIALLYSTRHPLQPSPTSIPSYYSNYRGSVSPPFHHAGLSPDNTHPSYLRGPFHSPLGQTPIMSLSNDGQINPATFQASNK